MELSEVDRALEVARAGSPDLAIEMLRDYIERQGGRLSWGLYYATHYLEILTTMDSKEDAYSQVESQALFHQLVPLHITRDDLARRLHSETEYFLSVYGKNKGWEHSRPCVYLVALTTREWGRDFEGQLRAFSTEEFLDFVWLQDGYTKWVDLWFFRSDVEATYIRAEVGGRVETFREVFHHDQGHAPFRTR